MPMTTTQGHWDMDGWEESVAFLIVYLVVFFVVHKLRNSFADVWTRLETLVLRLPDNALKILLIIFTSVSVVAPWAAAIMVTLPRILADVDPDRHQQ
ncbi:hypothetical protein AAVH_18816 [Aphelenchoides avenae]|nr:hypothetical protein AAVH_18816 [Aphelenchus avenae]